METTDNGKLVAIISYFSLIGWIIALILNNGNKTALGSFHIRQALGIMCVGVLLTMLASFVSIPLLSWIVWAGVVVLWILGIISAIQAEMKPVPVLGEQFQEWFKGL
ncbi:hypothetical protein [Aequorivita sp. Q41]|uniref:DUF4870 domain-containing protein n=1 Tax=Aequorivita sp. Q41 TaxID=3153300 RepID=UPI003242057E